LEKIIVITGPTASGKTALAVELAKHIDGEIVSADSMQIYKGMDIGTAKPTLQETAEIPHHMIDRLDPRENYSVADYKKDAEDCIENILARNKRPIIAGGTGLYINALVYNIDFSETEEGGDIRKNLEEQARKEGNHVLYEKLKKVDPEAASKIHVNNTKRLIRALEVYLQHNVPFSQKSKEAVKGPKYDYRVFMLHMNRSRLYKRIDDRVYEMIKAGLEKEAYALYQMNLPKSNTCLQGIGYKEFFNYFKGLCTYSETLDIIKRETRRYAKRQITWMKNIQNVKILDMDKLTVPAAIEVVLNDYEK
jgi:tRNA dimethylallyltransferase